MTTDRRKRKRLINKLANDLSRKGYFINCEMLPAKVDEVVVQTRDWLGSDVTGTNLIPSRGKCSCSLWHCSPNPITKNLAEKLVSVYLNDKDSYSAFLDSHWNDREQTYV